MAQRPFPSFWMDKDHRGEWRWRYDASNHLTIAVSSEGYKNKADCRHSIELIKGSANAEVWLPTSLANAA